MTNTIQDLQKMGQSVWYDNIARRLLTTGELQRLIDLGVTGVTSNPSIFEKAISGSGDYDDDLKALSAKGMDAAAVYERLILRDISDAADKLLPVYNRTEAADGYVSLEPRPALAYDTDGTIKEIRHLNDALGKRPNVMLKVPGTPAGIPAVEALISQGININITLMFSVGHYEAVSEAYISGLERLLAAGGDLSRVSSVASFFVSRVDTAVDRQLQEIIDGGRNDLVSLLGKAGIANAKLAYRRFEEVVRGDRFMALKAKGARVQRVLWASTSAKNPAYSDVMYVEALAGPDTINTMPAETLNAFLDHGLVAPSLREGLDEAERTIEALGESGIDMNKLTEDLQVEGVRLFGESLDKLLAGIAEKQRLLAA